MDRHETLEDILTDFLLDCGIHPNNFKSAIDKAIERIEEEYKGGVSETTR